MLFNSIDFLLFFPCVIVGYYILPKKIRYFWLLAASYYFYGNWNPMYVWLLFGCTAFTYLAGRLISDYGGTRPKLAKAVLGISIAGMVSTLVFYKYLGFAVECINRVCRLVRLSELPWKPDILLPVGISFYTLQAMGYLIDVYRREIEAETNFFRYALFISFFPQLVAGPIERSQNLLTQLKTPAKFDYDNLRKGLLLVLWGLFCKMVIADRAAIVVDTVYDNADMYTGFYIVFATVLFAIQIYCDFYGYSTIARGAALSMGIRLTDNFEAPYFSKSVKEFWRRWHISLSGWFRDYLYIPLGGNRKGYVRKQGNLLFVFAVSGLWHGASLSYLFWGLLNGLFQVISDTTRRIKQKFHITYAIGNSFSGRMLKTAGTFGLVTFAWLFFRAGSLSEASHLVKNMCSAFNWTVFFDGSLYGLGVAKDDMQVLVLAVAVLAVVDSFKYRGTNVADAVMEQPAWFRICCFAGLTVILLLFGCYGEMYDAQQFIYFQF
jgi:D-alanyl-lipoteichoic acid acyltransferase DltB (MBOAT superfamily)